MANNREQLSADAVMPVILAGGTGTRLWPVSRTAFPKQYLALATTHTLLQETALRTRDFAAYGAPVLVLNEAHRFLALDQMESVGITPDAVILEPAARNTAPALAAVARFALDRSPNAILHVMPSDHKIPVNPGYWASIEKAVRAAEAGYLVTFGVTPDRPETGYGYIKAGDALADGAHRVAAFIEKPELPKAERMVKEGGYLWNSGMFLFRADKFLEELEKFAPDVAKAADEAVAEAKTDLDFLRLDAKAFSASPNISVDYAVFEKTDRAAVVPCDIRWSDLGAWDAVWQELPQDEDRNVAKGPATITGSKDTLIYSEGPHIAVSNMENVAVIATEDAVLVSPLDDAQAVKDVVGTLKAAPATADLADNRKTMYRPWGGYTSLTLGDRFQVKRIFVRPGKKLSLQKHHHRAEHWIVVQGTAEVTVDDKVMILKENESTYIPLGAVHRLANPGKILLEIIEVQAGSYLGEDDIIRIEDDFGRN